MGSPARTGLIPVWRHLAQHGKIDLLLEGVDAADTHLKTITCLEGQLGAPANEPAQRGVENKEILLEG